MKAIGAVGTRARLDGLQAAVRREAENVDPDPLDAAAELEALRSRMVRLARQTQR